MNLQEQIALRKSLSEERFEPYLKVAQQHFGSTALATEKALELYDWSAELAGLFHTMISYVEVAVRNSINSQLIHWNEEHRHSKFWTRRMYRDETITKVIDPRDIGRAVALAKRGKRGNYNPNQNDVIAKLTLSFWVNLVRDQGQSSDLLRQKMWASHLNLAFPFAQERDEYGNIDLEKTRRLVANQLSGMLTLRNRIAHHDNLLRIDYEQQIHRMYALLGRVGGNDLTASTDFRPLRSHLKLDPRRAWQRQSNDTS